jgi:DNA-binding response OmpR family regulator
MRLQLSPPPYPDNAIVDATLKDGSCLELARELRARDVPFLIYSGRRAIEEYAPEMGGIPWIDKPSSPEFVLSRAVKLLNGSPPEARA